MSAKSYIQRLTIFVLLAIVSVVAINYFVDPYAIMGVKRVAGFNQYKADINDYTRLSKKYQPFFDEYDALIVGNSRVEVGIDPSHACFVDQDLSTYNLGLPGASVRRQLAYALNVLYQQPVRLVLLSLDFTDFLLSAENRDSTSSTILEERAGYLGYLPNGEHNPAYPRLKLVDYYKALFSLDALVSSAHTLVSQGAPTADRDTRGFNPAEDFAHAVDIEGARALFEQKMQELERKYHKDWFLRDSTGKLSQSFDDLADFLSVTEVRDIEVVLFTNPFHEQYWSLMKNAGLYDLHQEWLLEIDRLVRNLGKTDIALWDFSGESPYIHEKVPAPEERSGPLRWFWEPAHYRAELGDLMVEAVLAERCNGSVRFGNRMR